MDITHVEAPEGENPRLRIPDKKETPESRNGPGVYDGGAPKPRTHVYRSAPQLPTVLSGVWGAVGGAAAASGHVDLRVGAPKPAPCGASGAMAAPQRTSLRQAVGPRDV